MSEEEENLFQQSNSCWIYEKLIDHVNEKVRDHCHVTGKFRGAAKDLMKKNYLLENIFLVLQKEEKLIMTVKYQTIT